MKTEQTLDEDDRSKKEEDDVKITNQDMDASIATSHPGIAKEQKRHKEEGKPNTQSIVLASRCGNRA